MPPSEHEQISRIPPQNAEAERAVLGACLLDADAVSPVREFLRAEDFYAEGHRAIFGCICELCDNDRPFDLVTVSDELRKQGILERAGGVAYIASLTEAVPATAAAAHYARIVAEKAQLRALIAMAAAISAEGYNGALTAAELMEMAEQRVFQLSEGRRRSDFHSLPELVDPVFALMQQIKATNGVTGIPTFRDLDRMLSGLQKSDLIILAARPAVGKTSMALNIAQNAAVQHGKTVAIFSLEMPKEQLVQRMLCTEARVDQSLVRIGMASKQDFNKIDKKRKVLSKAQIYIDDSMYITVSEMRSKCRKLKLEQELDLIVIDYIQLMQGGSGRHNENRQQEVSDISRSLKAMAKELDVPVLALSQLSRQAVQRGVDAPNLSHLRESGALEQDADVVLILHQPKESADNSDDNAVAVTWGGERSKIVKVNVAKHRNGPTGETQLLFMEGYTCFVDLAPDYQTSKPLPSDSSAPPPAAADAGMEPDAEFAPLGQGEE
ncbi:MAG: replicative DNA helicase [Bacillota bacterium]|nr:replicative DNA helicase [Bacillota bacterium]